MKYELTFDVGIPRAGTAIPIPDGIEQLVRRTAPFAAPTLVLMAWARTCGHGTFTPSQLCDWAGLGDGSLAQTEKELEALRILEVVRAST